MVHFKEFLILFGKCCSHENFWINQAKYHARDIYLYVDVYSITMNQIFSSRDEGSFNSSILQFSFNYACDLPRSDFSSSFRCMRSAHSCVNLM